MLESLPDLPLQQIAGFERSAYARLHGRIVWAGQGACTDHPRNAWRPWQPAPWCGDAAALAAGARLCWMQLEPKADDVAPGAAPRAVLPSVAAAGDDSASLPGLLAWLHSQPLPFPLQRAAARFDAVRAALWANDLQAFEAAALRVLGVGPGLTPSGDDFIGAIFFALSHAPRPSWQSDMPALQRRVLTAAEHATNPISAALLEDLIAGSSYRALHELLAALQSGSPQAIWCACQALLRVGASSGADMLAGLLLALITHPAGRPASAAVSSPCPSRLAVRPAAQSLARRTTARAAPAASPP